MIITVYQDKMPVTELLGDDNPRRPCHHVEDGRTFMGLVRDWEMGPSYKITPSTSGDFQL